MIRFKAFTDPLYGSDKYLATYIKFGNGKHFWAAGHHADEIKAAQVGSGKSQ